MAGPLLMATISGLYNISTCTPELWPVKLTLDWLEGENLGRLIRGLVNRVAGISVAERAESYVGYGGISKYKSLNF